MTKVVGAVPTMAVAGLVVSVPPVMLEVVPAPDVPSSNQVVVNVITVGDALAFTAAVVRMYSGVYGEVALFNWNMVTGVVVN